MSKDKLHEIVQKEYRTLPAYTFAKNGPDQAPQFRAFVSFCGLTFQSPGFYRTVRQAENAAADAALEALSAKPDDEPMQTNELVQTNGPMQADGPAVTGMLGKRQRIEVFQQPEERISTPQFLPDTQKSQLQDYAKKSGFDLPVYFCICEETSCVAGFKATVKFNGQTYESPGLFNSMRQAEHAAAAVVLKSLSERGPTLVAPPMYKNYLQIKAQKEGRPLPVYNTTMSGQSHAPVFTSTVNFNGMTFEGKAAKSKKQAENNAAASAASFALKDLGGSAVSAVQVNNDKGKARICDLNDNLLIQAINHLKEQTTRVESNGELSRLDLSTSLSVVSLLEPSEAFKTETQEELEQKITTNMLGNGVEDNVQQTCKTESKKEMVQNVRGNRVEDNGQQACKTESKKELVQNMTSVLGNRVEDIVQQPCRSSPTEFSSGTRIRVIPTSEAFSTKPRVVMNLTAGSVPSQNGAPEN